MPRLVVKKHRPLEIFLYCLVLSIVFSLAVWFFLDANHWNVIKSRFAFSQEAKQIWRENRKLEQENQQLQDKVIMLERLTRLDEKTAAELQDEIRSLQDQIYRLTGELEFYQGIMSSTTNSKGLNIQGLHIEMTDQPALYRYKLILTNVAKSDNLVKVAYDIAIEGMSGSDTQVLALSDVATIDEDDQTIEFSNFKRIEGSISLPRDFKPLRVVVDLRQKNVSNVTVQRVFEWPVTTG